MEDHKRNGILNDSLSKRDKKRQQISSRLGKLDVMFSSDRDNFYKTLLHNLQNTLATLQQGVNEEYLDKKENLEEERDYELTRLRLWEEYQVKRIEEEYKEDLTKAQENHDKMIKLIKEKLYDKLQKQIKQLKEDKLLLNLVNANSWSSNTANDSSTAALNAVAANTLNLADRRSLRKRELSSRLTAGEADDLSDGGAGSTTTGNLSMANGYISLSGKRRRHYATRYSSNDEMSSGITSTAASNKNNSGNGHSNLQNNAAGSGNESNLSDKDYDALNTLIMGNEDGGVSLVLLDNTHANSNKPNTRGLNKQFTGLQGLKPEELNDDLTLLRNAIVKKEK
ncbi:unnamed protein product [Debaryomyces fabryi]|nr:unnamed protein product [Debaryomyces fabryi]